MRHVPLPSRGASMAASLPGASLDAAAGSPGVPVPPLQAAGPGLCTVRHLWQMGIFVKSVN